MSRLYTLRMPASCGELLQGMISGEEKLLSYPVNLYNYLILERRKGNPGKIKGEDAFPDLPEKMLTLIKLAARDLGISPSLLAGYRWQHRQLIPSGKGLASSTADLMLGLAALSLLGSKKLSYQEILGYLTAIEPTDSIIFPELTLLEQNRGSFWQRAGQPEGEVRVLALGQPGSCDTLDQRKFRGSIPDVTEAWRLFQQGVRRQDWRFIGKAATFSARAWQQQLNYPLLEEIISEAESQGCLGVNIAHSGNVLGILYQTERADIQGLKSALLSPEIKAHYPAKWELELIRGGVEVLQGDGRQFKKFLAYDFQSNNRD